MDKVICYYDKYVSKIVQLNKTFHDFNYIDLNINYDYIIDILLSNDWESSIRLFKQYYNFREKTINVFASLLLFATDKYIKLNHINELDKCKILINRIYYIFKDYNPGFKKLLSKFIREVQKGNIYGVKIYLDTFLDQLINEELKNIYFYAFAEGIFSKIKVKKNNENIQKYNDIIKYVFDKCRTYIHECNKKIQNEKVSLQLNKFIFAEYKIGLIVLNNVSSKVSNILKNRQDINPGIDIFI